MIFFIWGCSSLNTDTSTQLLDPEIIDIMTWQQGDLSQDPLSSHQPNEVDCRDSSFRIEGTQFEVQTDLCNYAYVEFPAIQTIPAGTQVELLLLLDFFLQLQLIF